MLSFWESSLFWRVHVYWNLCSWCSRLRHYRVCLHDVTAAMLGEEWNILLGTELYFYANSTFCFYYANMASGHMSEHTIEWGIELASKNEPTWAAIPVEVNNEYGNIPIRGYVLNRNSKGWTHLHLHHWWLKFTHVTSSHNDSTKQKKRNEYNCYYSYSISGFQT